MPLANKASNRTSRGFRLIAVTLALSGFTFHQQAYAFKKEFPRLGGGKHSAPQNYDDPAVQSLLAKLDFLVVDFLPGWRGGGVAMRNAMRAIKAKNPNVVIVDYVNLAQVHNSNRGHVALRSKLEAHHWYLYASGTGGTKVASPGEGPAFSVTNPTAFVPRDAAGDRWHNWFAKHHFDQVWRHLLPELDGTFTDNFLVKPRVVGDWNRDGRPDSPNDPAVGTWWRQGIMAHVDQMRALMPGKLMMGNLQSSGLPGAVSPEYRGRMHGGIIEHLIGATWSAEGRDMNGVVRAGSWKTMMDRYRNVMAILAEPRIMAFNMKGNPTDYKTFRYGFASALMDDGYFDFSDGTGGNLFSPKRVPWFDEFDLAGTANTRWLGTAVDAPPTSPWKDGVYRRRFKNGMALVNPRGNGARTVTIEPGYRRFLGNQARTINNGNPATRITLQDRDGILLKKN
ncbi:MAG: putative glycoside hydrolase [Gammaproteobacteria bacterium]